MSRYSATRGTRHRVSKSKAKAVLAAIVAGAPLLVSASADAANRSWLGASGNWSDFAFWSGGMVPAANDDVFIVNADIQFRTVTQNAGHVSINNFTVDNAIGLGSNILALPGSSSIGARLQQIGVNGRGEFNNLGGTNALSASTFGNAGLMLGVNVNGRGIYRLSNDGNLMVAGSNTSSVIGSSGFGTFIHDSGNASFTSLTLGENVGGVGSYLLGASARL